MNQINPSSIKRFDRKLLITSILLILALACNLPFVITDTEAVPAIEDMREEAAQTQSAGDGDDSSGAATPETAPRETQPGEVPTKAPELDIQPADVPIIPDCNAFDIQVFNSIIDGEFTFITQDQLNNCHYESDNGFRMLMGGGKPSTVEEIKQLFDSSFGQLPDSTWEQKVDHYLGLAYSSVSVTAQGVSGSGHSIVVVVGSEPRSDTEALHAIFSELAQEAAKQLNAQFE